MRRFPALLCSALLAALLALVLTGCGGTSSSSTVASTDDSPSSSTSPSAPATSTSPTAAPTPVAVRRDDTQAGAAFTTPSGNIFCWVDTGRSDPNATTPSTVGCTIIHKSWTAPKSNCRLEYGNEISFTGKRGAIFDCRGDIASCFRPTPDMPDACGQGANGLWWHQADDGTVKLGGSDETADVLPYGTAVRIGSLQCTSQTSGVTCANAATGQGFTISRESYRLTPA